MLRVDAYTTTEGLLVSVVGHCSGKRHAGERCETAAASQLVQTSRIERYGTATAMVVAVQDLLLGVPQLEALMMC